MRYAALLRGINVGGKHRLPMKDLIAIFEALGCEDVRTYVQSGNVVFDAAAGRVRTIVGAVEEAVGAEHGFELRLVTRSAVELARTLDASPFALDSADEARVLVGFLGERPDPERVRALEPDRSPPDRFEVVGREVHLDCPNGLARSRCTNAWFDRVLGTTSTFRNLRTVRRVLALVEDR